MRSSTTGRVVARKQSKRVRLYRGPAARSARLAVTAQIVDSDIATLLNQRISRYAQMQLANNAKVIDAQPINGKASETKPQVETKPPLASTSDRRFRRF